MSTLQWDPWWDRSGTCGGLGWWLNEPGERLLPRPGLPPLGLPAACSAEQNVGGSSWALEMPHVPATPCTPEGQGRGRESSQGPRKCFVLRGPALPATLPLAGSPTLSGHFLTLRSGQSGEDPEKGGPRASRLQGLQGPGDLEEPCGGSLGSRPRTASALPVHLIVP